MTGSAMSRRSWISAPGQFLAEVGSLSGDPSLIDAHAEGEVEALVIQPEGLRRLLIAEAELGERIMRAMILRRVSLIESGTGGIVLIGAPNSVDMARIENFLTRNALPHHTLDPATDPEAREVIARYAPKPGDLPLVVAPDGEVLRNPDDTALAHVIGMLEQLDPDKLYDVAVVGCGPGGTFDRGLCGLRGSVRGGAGTADVWRPGRRQRPYRKLFRLPDRHIGHGAGQPRLRAGAEIRRRDRHAGRDHAARLHDARTAHSRSIPAKARIRARCVVIASGARYRRLAVDNLAEYEGRGVWYWASPIEARLCANEEVVLVGGGNSAGQAAVFLAAHASKVRIIVRGAGLAATMSRYLIDRIEAAPNIEVMPHTEVIGLAGDGRLERVRWRNRKTGEEAEARDRQSVSVHRRRSGHRLACRIAASNSTAAASS